MVFCLMFFRFICLQCAVLPQCRSRSRFQNEVVALISGLRKATPTANLNDNVQVYLTVSVESDLQTNANINNKLVSVTASEADTSTKHTDQDTFEPPSSSPTTSPVNKFQNVTISNIGQSLNNDAMAPDLPVQCDSAKMWHFQSTWFGQFTWLHFCPQINGVSRYYCAKENCLGLLLLRKNNEDAFISSERMR